MNDDHSVGTGNQNRIYHEVTKARRKREEFCPQISQIERRGMWIVVWVESTGGGGILK
jgi:hypothetical protein